MNIQTVVFPFDTNGFTSIIPKFSVYFSSSEVGIKSCSHDPPKVSELGKVMKNRSRSGVDRPINFGNQTKKRMFEHGRNLGTDFQISQSEKPAPIPSPVKTPSLQPQIYESHHKIHTHFKAVFHCETIKLLVTKSINTISTH